MEKKDSNKGCGIFGLILIPCSFWFFDGFMDSGFKYEGGINHVFSNIKLLIVFGVIAAIVIAVFKNTKK